MTSELSTRTLTQGIHRIWVKNLIDTEEREATGVQEIEFRHYNYYPAGMMEVEGSERIKFEVMIVSIDGRKYDPKFIKTLAKNEGFDDLLDFHKYFWPLKNFKGKIIHYTDFRYR